MSGLSKEHQAKLVAEYNALPMHSGDPSPAENSESLPLDDVAAKIKREHAAVKEALQESVCHAEAAGRLLIAAKARVPHGQWGEWIDTNCEFSERTAQVYMRVARELPKLDPEKAQRVADLPLRQVLDELTDHLIVGTPAGWSVKLPKAVSEKVQTVLAQDWRKDSTGQGLLVCHSRPTHR